MTCELLVQHLALPLSSGKKGEPTYNILIQILLKTMLGKKICLIIDLKIATVPHNTHTINMFVLGFATWPCQYYPTVFFFREFLRVLKKQGAQGQQHQFCPCITYSVYRCWVVLKVFLRSRI